MTQLPRLLDADMAEIARLEPSSLSLDLNMAPVSTAVMVLPEGQPEAAVGSFIELFTPHGSAGIFRVQQASQSFGGDIRLNLEHGLVTLSDSIIPGALEEEKTSTAQEALAEILGYQDVWKLGTVAVPTSETLTWGYDYSNVLESLLSILDELPAYMATFDQTTTPWGINVVAVNDEPASECRLTRNLSSLNVETDRSELCTRLYIPGLEAPLDADTIDTWGVVSRSLTGDEGLTAGELTAYGRKYLEEHKNPALVVSLDAVDLSKATGEALDAFSLGRVCQVCLPDYAQTITQRIVTISYPDLIADDTQVQITLASKAETTADALAGLIVDTTVMRKQYWAELSRQKEILIAADDLIQLTADKVEILSTDFEVISEQISLYGEHFELIDNQLSTVQIDLDAVETAVTAKAEQTDVDDLKTRVSSAELYLFGAEGQAGLVTQVAENGVLINQTRLDLDAVEETATLLTGKVDNQGDLLDGALLRLDGVENDILLQADTIQQKADLILLDGYVKMADFEATNAEISNILSGMTTATVLRALLVDASNGSFDALDASIFNHNGALVSQRTITMGEVSSVGSALSTGGDLDLQHSHKVSVSDDGTVTLGEVATQGGNFRIADTKAYKEGVSAAIDSVTLSASGWDANAQNTIKASNGKELKVTIPNVSMGQGSWLSGKKTVSAYYGNSGQLGSLEVEIPDIAISWSNPAQGYAMVSVTVGGKTRTDSRNVTGYV